MIKKVFFILAALFVMIALYMKFSQNSSYSEHKVTFMATTTLEDSGFLHYIVEKLEKDTGLSFKIITAGTGQILRMAQDGNADILLVHDPKAEKSFIAAGYASKRIPVFYNDFILIGPQNDPAHIKDMQKISTVFRQLKSSKSSFISRGDYSGTHQAEINIWMSLDFSPDGFSNHWYQKTGSGMGASLNIAVNNNSYILSDRATWLAFKNKQNHQILFENQAAPELQNIYSLLLLNPQKFPAIDPDINQRIAKWFQEPKTKKFLSKFSDRNNKLYFINTPSL